VFPLSMLNASGQTVTSLDGSGIPLAPYRYSLAQTPAQVAEFNNLLNYTLLTLPEWRNQSNNLDLFPELKPGGNYDLERYNVILNQAATIDVSFVYEGAGYRNSLGYFTFDPANPPTRASLMTNGSANKVLVDGIIFPNASLFNAGGSYNGLYTGDTMKLTFNNLASYAWNQGKDCSVVGNCKLGVGFFLVADGFQNITDPYTGISTNGGVRPYPDPNWVFYSLRDLNPEVNTVSNPDISQHTVLLNVPNTNLYAIGFEDMNRTPGGSTDHDFNDVVYRLSVTPNAAFSNSSKVYGKVANDSDGDGVPDNVDEFPLDPTRATSSWYPSKSTWNTLAYEDMWPSHGDYDMNDLVVQYRYRLIRNAAGTVKELELYYQLAAAGAGNHSGFGLELTGIPKSTPLDYARLSINGAAAQAITPATTNNLVFRVFNDALSELGGGTQINTVPGGTRAALKTYQLNIAFTTPLPTSAFSYGPPYNPFLFGTNAQGTEVHLPGRQPTSAASVALFGTQDDNTSVAAQRYYVDKQGHPWALDLPSGWKWPTEYTDIATAYPYFKPWAESGGVSNTDWYTKPLGGKTY
jgi:LruC domain-containing protein